MEWLENLLIQPSCLQTVIFLSVICAIGLAFGQIKFKGVSLGVAFVFFAGIITGEITKRSGVQTEQSMITFAQNFGLIMFVYSLGVQVGPGFFTSLKRGGLKLNLLGLGLILLTTLMPFVFSAIPGLRNSDLIGILCGAVTNTPMLGAAQQTLIEAHPGQMAQANDMATACAVAYPFGVLGVLGCIIIIKFIFKDRLSSQASDTINTFVAEYHVSNPFVFGKMVKDLAAVSHIGFIITRIWRNGVVTIPSSESVLQKDDHLLLVTNKDDVESLNMLFGDKENTDWNRPDINWDSIDNSHLVSKHVLVTRKNLNGAKLGNLHLRNSFGVNVTRINRAGIELLAMPGIRLQLGDMLTIVGEAQAIRKVSDILGNEEKELTNPNLTAMFIGMVLGVILGMIPLTIPGISTPVKLGIAGGPIIIGILMGAFGPRIHLSTYTTRSANLMLRQMGIVIYLACLGFNAGGSGFFETAISATGLLWIGISLIIATVPVLISALISGKVFKLNYAQNAGMICAAMANPMALTYASSVIDDEEASEAYATVYPLSMFIRVISAQLIMLLII